MNSKDRKITMYINFNPGVISYPASSMAPFSQTIFLIVGSDLQQAANNCEYC